MTEEKMISLSCEGKGCNKKARWKVSDGSKPNEWYLCDEHTGELQDVYCRHDLLIQVRRIK